jgi:hypothetical protein
VATSLFDVAVGPIEQSPAPFRIDEPMWSAIWAGLVHKHGVGNIIVPPGQLVRVRVELVDEADTAPFGRETGLLRPASSTSSPASTTPGLARASIHSAPQVCTQWVRHSGPVSAQSWEVSRDLDQAIAERVFGYHTAADPLPYSSDITAAWRIVYRFQALGWSLVLHGRPPHQDPIWTCTAMGPEGLVLLAHGPIAALTLCRAALLVLGSMAEDGK